MNIPNNSTTIPQHTVTSTANTGTTGTAINTWCGVANVRYLYNIDNDASVRNPYMLLLILLS